MDLSSCNKHNSSGKKEGFNTAPREEWKLLTQGAEARVWKIPGNPPLVCKERFSKSYRHPELDARLTKSRTRSEARILEKCRNKSEIRVPKVVRVEKSILYIEFLSGSTVKEHLLCAASPSSFGNEDEKMNYDGMARKMGVLIARLHNLGVIHGDLTTSNMMIEEQNLVLIDFGLAKSTSSVEEQAVDLYVLERALQSTHPGLPQSFFDTLILSYSEVALQNSLKKSQTTLQRLEQVRLRGRKRECFG
jgi:TP53 regulating kinase-like protein